MAGFFDNAFPAGAAAPNMAGAGGLGGSPSAFTSPGMNPQILALLMAMGQRQQQQPGSVPGATVPMMGGPMMPGAPGSLGGGMVRPPILGAAPMPPGTAGAPPSVGAGMQANPMLQQLLANPQLLKQLLGGMGGGS
jgi:hypothetical protein